MKTHYINILRLSNYQKGGSVFVGAIADLNVTAFDDTSITLDWTTPSADNPIDYYEVYLDGVFHENTTDDTEGWVITGLTAGTSYDITLKTVDTLGNKSGFSNEVTQSTTSSGLLLDDASYNAVHAYSHRKLRTAYAGNAIEILRSSDSTTSNIGFASNQLDETALTTFVGANNGRETKIYDQVGSRNLEQSTDANRPSLVISGTIQKSGGKPMAKYDGGDFLSTSAATSIIDKNSTLFIVIESQSGASEGLFEEVNLASSGQRIALYSPTTTSPYYVINHKPAGASASLIAFGSSQPISTRRILTYRKTGSLIEAFAEGVKIGEVTDANVFSTTTVLEIGRQLVGPLYFNGKIAELIVCNSSISNTKITEIVNNQKAYYTIA